MPPERLIQIAHCLEVTPDYFSSTHAELADDFEHFVQSPEGIALCRAMALIPDAAMRARLILAVAAFSDSQAKPEDRAGRRRTRASALRLAAADRPRRRQRPPQQKVAAGIHATKVELAQLIGKTLKARKLTQKFAARILRTDQARISALARGNVEATSL